MIPTPGATGVRRVCELADGDLWWDGDDETWRPATDARAWYDGWQVVEVVVEGSPSGAP